jgi:hypothetical protein
MQPTCIKQGDVELGEQKLHLQMHLDDTNGVPDGTIKTRN